MHVFSEEKRGHLFRFCKRKQFEEIRPAESKCGRGSKREKHSSPSVENQGEKIQKRGKSCTMAGGSAKDGGDAPGLLMVFQGGNGGESTKLASTVDGGG